MQSVKELRVESGCEHSGKKTTCERPKPGATTGGCAFEGAQISLFPYSRAAHLVHGPMTCLGASWETRQTPSSNSDIDFTQMGFTTDTTLNDIIFGGDKKLNKAIDYIYANYKPEAIFVYSTCVTALIGDDINNTCKASEAKFSIPVIPVHAPGFLGNKNFGSRLAGEAVLEHLIGKKTPDAIHPFGINLIGEYNVTGDMWQYKYLLEEIGIKIVSTLSGDGEIKDIMQAHTAKLNVIVCAKSLVTLTRKMSERYGIPYISTSFYGKTDTTNAIMEIVNAFGDEALIQRAKEIVKREEDALEKKLAFYKDIFRGKKAILNTGGNKSWSFISALQDLGIKVVATSINKATEDDTAKAREYLGADGVLMKSPANEQAALIKEHNVDILLAGGRSLYTALKNKIAFVDVNQEKKLSYGGYNGLLNFAKDLYFALNNPVFKLASKEAPWTK
jgi:nitrogenase molybdenum-cofactor synthesis protein NifE